MCRKLMIWLTLFAGCLLPVAVHAADPDAQAMIRRGVELFGQGRWSDARHEMVHAQKVLAPSDRAEREQVEYYLAACAVELGSRDAEAALKSFTMRWPASCYNNDMRFALASYYCTQGDMEAAARTFAEVDYKALPARRREQYDIRMGYAAFASGRYAEADEHFARIRPGSEYADHALYYRSYIDYASGRYAEAKQGFGKLAWSAAYADVVPYFVLQLEFMEGNYSYVVERGDALIASAVPQHRMELERVMAESWYHQGDFNKTIAYLSAYLRDGGQFDRNEEYLMGYSLYRTARYAEAEEFLRRACGGSDALTQNASYHLADCYVRRGAKREAMQAFALAANGAGDAAIAEDALFNYGKLQYELGGGIFNEAINVLTRYLEQYPESPRTAEARELLIAAYYNSHNYDAAYAAIKSFPNPDAGIRSALQKIAYFRGLEAFTRGDMQAAEESLAESAAVDVSPKYAALVLFWQGEIAYEQGDYDAAAAHYDAYLRRAPRTAREYPLALYNLGYADFTRERMENAKRSFSQFLTLNTGEVSYRADAWCRLGDVQATQRAFNDAAQSYAKAEAMGSPAKYYAEYRRALMLGLLQKQEPKIEVLKRIVAAAEGDYADDAAYELGSMYIAREQYADGVRVLERFISEHTASPLRAQAFSALGLACLNIGDKERALKYYDRAIAAAPRSAEAKGAMEAVRDIYVSQGDADAFFAYAEKMGLESDTSLVARDSLTFAAARQHYLAGNHAHAAASLRSYVDHYPKGYYMTDALYYLSDSYLREKRRVEAIETLTALVARGQTAYTVTALERLATMTFEDGRYDEAATAYRRLYDAVRGAAERANAMTGYVRATLKGDDPVKVAPMAADVAAVSDAGTVAVRESQFALAEQLRGNGKQREAMKIYRTLAAEVKSAEGAASGYYILKDLFDGGDMAKTEKAIFDYTSKATPHAYWLAKAYLLLGDVYAAKGDAFQAQATYRSVADGYSPDNDGIIDEARERISKMK